MGGLDLLCGGLGAGVAMAAPVGPVAALCISVTLRRGRAHGVVAGLGAASADAVFAAVAMLGLTGMSTLLAGREAWLQTAGGVLLAAIAIARWRRGIAPLDVRATDRADLPRSFLAPLLLTWANPATILSFAAVLGALGLDAVGKAEAALVTAGVFTGALAWWIAVASIAGRLRSAPRALQRLDRIVTLALAVFAAGLLVAGTVRLVTAPLDL